MPKKILLLHPTTKEDIEGKSGRGVPEDGQMGLFESAMQAHAAKVTRPDTVVRQRFLDSYSGSLQNLYLATVNSLPVVRKIIAAEKEGFDAVVIGNHVDSGVQAARAAVDIPVIGPLRSVNGHGRFFRGEVLHADLAQTIPAYPGIQYSSFRFRGSVYQHPARPMAGAGIMVLYHGGPTRADRNRS